MTRIVLIQFSNRLSVVVAGLTGRSSIPETSAIEPRSRGVLDHPHLLTMTTEYDFAISRR
jgi:hypothetical protein